MRRTLLCYTIVVGVICLIGNAAEADDCQPINVRIGPSDFLGSCSYLTMDFDFCIDTPLRGTLNGVWHYYAVDPNGGDEEPGGIYSPYWHGWAIGLIETKRGDISLQDNWLINLNTITPDHRTPFVSLIAISGGTRHYDSATGWLGVIADDFGDWRGWARGEICVP